MNLTSLGIVIQLASTSVESWLDLWCGDADFGT